VRHQIHFSFAGATLFIAVLAVGCGSPPGETAHDSPTSAAVAEPPPSSTEFSEFNNRVDAYLQVRERAERAVPNLKETSDPKKISSREKALADAIRIERAGARQGELFTDSTAAAFRRIVSANFAKRSPAEKAAVFAEVPLKVPPSINTDYPTELPLATVPPSLLVELPTLPDAIEYRFLGRHLILRDAKANLIVDFLPDIVAAAR
jgi:hypothetical protein